MDFIPPKGRLSSHRDDSLAFRIAALFMTATLLLSLIACIVILVNLNGATSKEDASTSLQQNGTKYESQISEENKRK